ncbi:hypothetical protein NT6N_00860 [Oceaniferula spumae]|uniref:Cobalamin biosynthesis protein CbiX n=1 Tax=Oceaniferula spumae TaxID=2979115 RepID=A0AAT9FGE6_9BACT
MSNQKKTALLILGHGSSKHPESSASVRMHTEVLRERGDFAEVHCAFLKEEPFIADALDKIEAENICIVPDFLAEGYFTRQVIPELLKLDQQPETVRYCPPVGTNDMMQQLIEMAAMADMKDWKPEQTSLLLVGHGSTKNSKSKQTLLDHIEALKQTSPFAQITDVWLEEAPFVQDWQQFVTEKQVLVLPFLLSNGQHGGWDIPAELGIGKGDVVHGVTHTLQGRNVRIAPALGTSPQFAGVIAAIAHIWGGQGT